VIELHQMLAGVVPHIAPLVGFTERVSHDHYFGDALRKNIMCWSKHGRVDCHWWQTSE
jgi:hypothetical protein